MKPIVYLLAAALVLPATARAAAPAAKAPAADRARERVKARWGVEPVSVRLAEGGYLVNFRYRVTDAERAKALFHDGIKPYLVDRKTGRQLAMPADTKLGGLRSSPRSAPEVGKQYYVLFGNQAKEVRSGSRVNVVVGPCQFKDLAVE